MSEILKKHNEFLQTWRKYKDTKGPKIELEGEAKWKLLNNDLVAASAQIREWNEVIECRKRKGSITNFLKKFEKNASFCSEYRSYFICFIRHINERIKKDFYKNVE